MLGPLARASGFGLRPNIPGLAQPPVFSDLMAFPQTRLRRMRATRALRGLVRETHLDPSDFVYPMFVAQHGEPIRAMPGISRLSIGQAVHEAGEAAELGIPAVLLFGLPADKDED